MVATKTIVIAAIITAICVTALVVGIVLGTRSSGCSGDATIPANVTVTYTEAGLEVKWEVPEEDADCQVSYQFMYSYDLGGQHYSNSITVDDLEELKGLISPVAPCVEVEFHIIPINEDGEESSEHYIQTYTVPLKTVASPTNIQFNSEDENELEITWSSPDVGECNISYRLNIIRDKGEPIVEAATDESYILSQSSFCLSFSLSIVAAYVPDGEPIESQPATADYQAPGVENIDEQKSEETLVVSWDAHPKASSCAIQYRVTYTVIGEDEVPNESTTDKATATFPTFYYCTPSRLTVTAFIDDSNSMTSSKDVEASDPETLSPVTDLSVSDELVVSWTPPDAYRKCSVTYILGFTTDIGAWQGSTVENEFQVTNEVTYCFFFSVMVEIRFSESISSSNNLYANHRDEPVINNLTIEENEENPHEWIATWEPHPKQDMCSFQYKLQVAVDDTVDYSTELNTAARSFDKTYCADGEVVVTISSPYGTSEKSVPYILQREDIDEIAGISAIEFTGDTDLVVRWRSPTHRCGETYKVAIKADGEPHNQLDEFEDVTYTVADGDYCFEVEVEITPVRNGEEGTAVSRIHKTAGVKNIEEEVDGNKLVISWDPHPKATTCGLNYRVTYSEDPTNPVTLADNTVTFDSFYYCLESKVTVTVFNADDEIEPTDKVIAPKNPTALDPVSDLQITDGIVSWKISELYKECALTYLLDFTTDRSITQEYTSDTEFTVSDSIYCFSYSVQVTARFDEVTVSSDNPSKSSTTAPVVDGLTVGQHPTNTDQWEVKWTPHAKQTICPFEYRVKLATIGNADVVDIIETETYAFNKVYCADGYVEVTILNNGLASEKSVTEDVPNETSDEPVIVSDIQFAEESGLVVTWSTTSKCGVVTYTIDVETDSDAYDGISDEEKFIVEDSRYCFWVKITVTPDNGMPVTKTYEIDGVQNIQERIVNNELIVEWDPHPKAVTCSLTYKVAYDVNGVQTFTTETDILSATFTTFYYCATSQLRVVAVKLDAETWPAIKDIPAKDPEAIIAVEDLSITTDRVVSWKKPVVYEKCPLTYTVVFDTDIEITNIPNVDQTEYIVTDSLPYCFDFSVQVTAYFGDLGGSASTSQSHSEDPVIKDLTVTELSTNPNQWEAKWTPHPREDVCSFQYKVEFISEGTTIDSDDVNTPSFVFDKICADGHVTVTIFNSQKTSGEETSEPVLYDESGEAGSISDIKFVEGEELVITWSTSSIRCSPVYRIHIETDTDDDVVTSSELEYRLDGSRYCLWVKVTVTIVQGGVDGASDSATFNSVVGPVSGLNVVLSADQLVASWDAHPRATGCSLEYEITYSFGSDEFYQKKLTALTDTFPRQYCTEGQVRVIASNSDISTDPATFDIPEESPPVVEVVSGVNVDKDTLMVSWSEIAPVGKCAITYLVSFGTDMGNSQSYNSPQSPFRVPDDIYCLSFDVTVKAIVGSTQGNPSTAISYRDESTVPSLVVETSTSNEDRLMATWDRHSRHTQCGGFTYRVTFSANNYENDVDGVSDTFDKEYCVDGEVSVVAFTPGGIESNPSTKPIDEEDPPAVEDVSGVNVDKSLMVSWSEIAPVGKCAITYLVSFDTDMGNSQSYDSPQSPFPVPDNIYCLSFDVTVKATVGSTQGNPSTAISYEDEFNIENLDIQATDTTIEVSWTPHAKIDLCNIKYTAKYSPDGATDPKDPTSITSSSATFEKSYCVEGIVIVTAEANAIGKQTLADETHEPYMPTSVGPVQNIQAVSEAPEEVTITWLPPVDLDRCNFVYDVSVTNNDDPSYSESCHGSDTSCKVPESCPTMEISISPSIDGVNGPSETETYTCVTNDIPNL